MRRSIVLAAFFASPALAPTPGFAVPLQIQNAFPNLPAFNWPVDLQAPFDGSDRLFVVEKDGRIWVIDNDPTVSTRTLFLDISTQVRTEGSNGLLALAFHPDYENNGTFFVMYNTITPNTSRWSRFQVSGDPDVADPLSEDPFIEIPQTNTCHKGCGLVFGVDGYLYISIGDDCLGWPGQDLTTLMGKLLRIDVDGTSPGLEYAIPPDNPFVGNQQGWREEIFAYGFRNPWRYSIDRPTNRIFVGDVGEATWEEINIVTKGRNYGWDNMEADVCYPNPALCDTAGMNAVVPIWKYPHVSELGAAVVGGYVYRGSTLPRLWNRYVYADVGEGVFALTQDGSSWTNELIYTIDPSKQFVTFGVDEEDELYVVSLFGQIYRFVDTNSGVGGSAPAAPTLVAEPNPFQTSTTLRVDVASGEAARIEVYDVRGRRVRVFETAQPAATITWNGTDDAGRELASGVYFARLVVDGRARVGHRIVLVR
jgi:glucose/arabinose dehydrogenase